MKEIRVVPVGGSPRACIYVYFDFQERELHTIPNLLANILAQLVVSLGEVSDGISKEYESYERNKKVLGQAEYLRLVQSELSSFGQVFLVIDGLDECSRHGTGVKEEFLSILTKLPEKVKILATSRPDRTACEKFRPDKELRITAKDQDLRAYITRRIGDPDDLKPFIDQGSSKDASYCEDFFSTILYKAQETFLLAHLHMDILAASGFNQSASKEPPQLRANLSKAWSEVYEQAMQRIHEHDEQTLSLALDILKWVFCASKLLTFDELADALVIQGHRGGPGSEIHLSEEAIKSACQGLVIVDRGNKVRLLHNTLQEFLECHPMFSSKAARSHIASACLDTLLRLQGGAILSYVVNNWGSFVTNCEPKLQDLVIDFQSDRSKVRGAVRMMDHHKLPREMEVTGLHLAAYFGLKAVTQRLVTQCQLNINQVTQHGRTALHWAVLFGQAPLTKKLVKMGANVNLQEYIKGRTALHQAIFDNSSEIITILLSRGSSTNVNLMDKEGWSPLRLAVKNGQVGLIKPLVDHGADIHAEDADGFTAMKWAADIGDRSMIKQLINCGADVNKPTERGWLILVSVARAGRADLVQMLVKHYGADVNKLDGDGWSALWGAVRYGHADVVSMLLQAGADMKAKLEYGRTVLHLMLREWKGYAKKSVLWLLLQHDPTIVNTPDENGSTPLHVALAHGDWPVIWMLLESGAEADISKVDSRETTPLHVATARGDKYVTSLLIEKGAESDINKPDNRELTPLHIAAKLGHGAVVELLLDKGASINTVCKHRMTALHKAAEHGHWNVIELLLKRGADQTVVDYDDRTALHIAVTMGHKKATWFLIQDTTVLDNHGQYGQSAVHIAAETSNVYLVEALANKGAQLNTHDDKGRTPLHLAVTTGNKEVVWNLLQRKADINATDNMNNTALHLAAGEGNQEIVSLLLSKLPRVEIRNNRGLGAVELAMENGHKNLDWS